MSLSADKAGKYLLVVLVPLFLYAGYVFFSAKAPDGKILQQRMSAVIDMGWPWLHVENMSVASLDLKDKNRCEVRFVYELVFDVDGPALSEDEKSRFSQFLPMCADTDLRKGARCKVGETMLFVVTREYGWMPEPAVRVTPWNLARIAAWKETVR
ncbi:MAG: hypothetical protein LBQ51_10175 [Desulfovibrio sp.]|jgi:hypothetical protein|nr:hypothetical protein [Desulfovibrio sp.]